MSDTVTIPANVWLNTLKKVDALAAENERLRKLLEMYLKADPLIGEAVASAMLAAKEGDRK